MGTRGGRREPGEINSVARAVRKHVISFAAVEAQRVVVSGAPHLILLPLNAAGLLPGKIVENTRGAPL